MILRSPSLAIWLRVFSLPLRSLQALQWLRGKTTASSMISYVFTKWDGMMVMVDVWQWFEEGEMLE